MNASGGKYFIIMHFIIVIYNLFKNLFIQYYLFLDIPSKIIRYIRLE